MAKRGRKNKADTNRQLFDKANSYARKKWFTDSQKSMDFYLNDQLTREEKEDLREGGMPDFTINRISPAIDVMKFFVTANNPRWQAIGTEGSDSDIAHIHSMVASYCWHLSNGKSLFGEVIQDALVKGMGLFRIDIDPDADKGMGEVVFKTVDPYDLYIDPQSRDFLFRDANFLIVQKNLSKSSLIRLFPQYKKKIVRASGQMQSKQYSQRDVHESETIQPGDIEQEAYTLEGEQDEIIDFYEVYTKEKIPYVNLFISTPPSKEELEKIKAEAQKRAEMLQQELQVGIEEQKQELMQAVQEGEMIAERMELELQKIQQDAQNQLQEAIAVMEAEMVQAETKTVQQVMEKSAYELLAKDNEKFQKSIVDLVEFYKTQIKVCASAGDLYLYETVIPNITEYPIVPINYNFTNTPYPVGAVMPMIGKQREINKSHQIMLHNANLASNLRWLYTEGSVDEEEWEKYSSAPGAMLKYRQGFDPPAAIQPLPINNAFYTVTQQGKQDIEHLSGISSSMQGVGQNSHETYRGMLAMDEYGTRRIRQWVNNSVEPALEHLGKIFKDVAQFVYRTQKVFRMVQPEAGATEGELQEVTINIPIYNDFGEAINRYNDYATSQFDIRIVAGSTQPINRWALLDEYFKWYQSGLIDDVAMLEQTDIRNKKAILQRKSIYAQMESQIKSMEEAVKNQAGTIETLERQLVQHQIKDKVNEGEKQIDRQVNQTAMEQKLLQGRMKDTIDMAKKELALEKKNNVDKQKK